MRTACGQQEKSCHTRDEVLLPVQARETQNIKSMRYGIYYYQLRLLYVYRTCFHEFRLIEACAVAGKSFEG